MGGAYIQQLEVGGLETGTLQTRGNLTVNGDASIVGGLNLGQGLFSSGSIGIGVSTGATALRVDQLGRGLGTGSTAATAIFNGGNVGIGNTDSAAFPNLGSMFAVLGNSTIGWTNTGSVTPAAPALGLSIFGNVGIGTTTA